jgi:hypothetical protein
VVAERADPASRDWRLLHGPIRLAGTGPFHWTTATDVTAMSTCCKLASISHASWSSGCPSMEPALKQKNKAKEQRQ